MKVVRLERFAYSPMGVFGILSLGAEQFFSVERPWLGNKPRVSCIPTGTYRCSWHPTTTSVPDSFEGKTWYLEGDTVGIPHDTPKKRSRIAIHRANRAAELEGCIAFGTDLGAVAGEWAVLNSDRSLRMMRDLLPDEFDLIITNQQ